MELRLKINRKRLFLIVSRHGYLIISRYTFDLSMGGFRINLRREHPVFMKGNRSSDITFRLSLGRYNLIYHWLVYLKKNKQLKRVTNGN